MGKNNEDIKKKGRSKICIRNCCINKVWIQIMKFRRFPAIGNHKSRTYNRGFLYRFFLELLSRVIFESEAFQLVSSDFFLFL